MPASESLRLRGQIGLEVKKLVAHQPNRVYYRVAEAEVDMAAQQMDAALAIYEQAYKQWPRHAGLQRDYATALLTAKQSARAFNLLNAAVRQTTDDPALFRQLAQAANDSGHPLEAHKAMAENYYLLGNPMGAIEQLLMALRYACDNFYQSSSIEARIGTIQDEIALLDPNLAERKKSGAPPPLPARAAHGTPQDCVTPPMPSR